MGGRNYVSSLNRTGITRITVKR